MNITREELDHILNQFSSKNMCSDMAMFFITQDLDYDDIFFTDYITPVKFYKGVFNYIYKYVINKIDRGQFDLTIRDVFTKLRCYNYLKKTDLKSIILRDAFSCKLIENTMLYLLRDNSLDSINLLIDILMVNPEVNAKVIYNILTHNPELCHQYILSHMISGEYLTIEQIYELLYERSKVTPLSTIKELVLELFNNKNMLLHFAAYVYSQYRIWMKPTKDSIDVHVDNLNKGERREFADNLRDFIIEIVWIDAEIEFWDFINESKVIHREDKNTYLSQVYGTYIAWYGSKMREQNSFANMIYGGYEEDLKAMNIDCECMAELSRDVLNLTYITKMEILDGYDLFIRLFNLNRFKLGHHRNMKTIRDRILESYEENEFYVNLAIDLNFYIFLCFR